MQQCMEWVNLNHAANSKIEGRHQYVTIAFRTTPIQRLIQYDNKILRRFVPDPRTSDSATVWSSPPPARIYLQSVESAITFINLKPERKIQMTHRGGLETETPATPDAIRFGE